MRPGTAITAVSHGEKSVLTTMIAYHCNTGVTFVQLTVAVFGRPSVLALACTDATVSNLSATLTRIDAHEGEQLCGPALGGLFCPERVTD